MPQHARAQTRLGADQSFRAGRHRPESAQQAFSDQRWRGFYPGRDTRSGNESVRIDFAPAGPNMHNGEVYTDGGWQAARFTRTPTGITVVFQDGRTSAFVRRGP